MDFSRWDLASGIPCCTPLLLLGLQLSQYPVQETEGPLGLVWREPNNESASGFVWIRGMGKRSQAEPFPIPTHEGHDAGGVYRSAGVEVQQDPDIETAYMGNSQVAAPHSDFRGPSQVERFGRGLSVPVFQVGLVPLPLAS